MTILREPLSVSSFPETRGVKTTATALSALGVGALMIDQSYRPIRDITLSREPSFRTHTNDRPGADIRPAYVLPGCRSDGVLIGELQHEVFNQSFRTVTFTNYPQRNFSIDSIKNGLIQHKKQAAEKGESDERSLFCAYSMGGMVLSHLLAHDKEFRQEFSSVDTVLLDSSPSSYADISPSSKKFINLARSVGNSEVAYRVAQRVMSRRTKSVSDHDDTLSDEQAARLARSTRQASLSVIRGQAAFMERFHVEPNALRGVVGRVVMICTPEDDVVDVEQAAEGWQKIYGDVEVIYDEDRPPTSHAAGTRYPKKIVRTLRGE